ncbi:MAG TPA: protein kinase [Thermoanaerobaculia bacterium]|nr:protein kinase [Thermoanaerobaculia bacterium]
MDRSHQISSIVDAALSRDAHERERFVADACAGDETLRREVETHLTTEVTVVRRTPAAWPSFGRRLAHYQIIDRLGAGGMGEVYRAHDEQLDRDVAIKVLPVERLDDQAARVRLLREARAAAALNHPHICTVYEVGEAEGQAYIAMELIEGHPLSALVRPEGLPAAEVLQYGVQLAGALAHAHDRGIVHRDLKSSNVIVSPDGRVKVLDFGLARRQAGEEVGETSQVQTSLTEAGTVVGTLAYMSPEQLRGKPAEARSDVWALGVMLYELAAGSRPFRGQTSFELSAAILNTAPPSLETRVPPWLQAVVERCLEKEPERRYGRGSEVRVALAAAEAQTDSLPAPKRLPSTPSPTFRLELSRRRAVWLAAVTVAALAAGISAWRWWPAGTETRSLAVLPLVNALDDRTIDYLCDGITDSLIAHISRLRSLEVTPSRAVFHFKGRTDVSPREAGRQLGVGTVLAGTVARQGGQLTIDVELLDVGSGAQLWRNRYQRAASDILSLQDEIAGAIIDEGLRLRLTGDDRRQLARTPTTDPEAYDLYLQARYLQRRATGDDYFIVRQVLQRVLVRDPEFADAYAFLGGTYAMMAVDGLERPTDAWPQNNRYMRRALELEPGLPAAHVLAHAQAFFFDWDWAGAEHERMTVLQARPGEIDPTWIRAFALERWALGRPDEALHLTRRMRELDRLSPDFTRLEADYLADTGRLDAAVALYEKAIQADPNDPNGYFGLAEALRRQSRFDEAIEARRQAHGAAGDSSLDEILATARGEEGYRALERRWVELQLEALTAHAALDYVSPLDFARAHAQLGHADEAFRHLDAAFVDRSPGLVFLNVDRAWDSIRNDSRFQAAVARVGLP